MPTYDLVPDFEIKINGSALSNEQADDVVMLAVNEDIGAPSMVTISMMTWDMTNLKMTWVDDSNFAEGNAVAISTGYVGGSLKPIFAGEITGIELELAAADVPLMYIRGYDRRHRLLRGRKTRSFLKMKDSAIASQIASEAGLSGQVTDTGVTHDYVMQHNQTDMEFLQDRAGRIGYEVVVDDKKLLFRPHQISESEAVTLKWEDDLIEFYARTTTLEQVGEVSVRGWDVAKKEAILGKSSSASKNLGSKAGVKTADSKFGKAVVVSTERPVSSKAEADKIAQGRFDEMSLAYITAEGVCEGRNDLRAGSVIKLEDIGTRFSGLYYITATRHVYKPQQGYRTHFMVRRNATDG